VPAYSYRHVPTIRAFSESDAFVRGLMGPLGGGKSSGCVWEIAQRGVAQRPGLDGVRRSRFAVIRQSYRQLEDSTIRTFHQWFPPYIHGDWKASQHTYVIRSLKAAADEPAAEIEVAFRALDRPDQVGNLLSTEYTGAWINEGRDPPWAIYEALMGRVGRYPAMRENGGPSWFGIFADTNPPDTESDWYKFFEEDDHSEAIKVLNKKIKELGLSRPLYTLDTYRKCFKQPSGLGPDAENLPNLDPLYYARQQVGKAREWIKVYLHGEYGFTIDGEPVFPEYSDGFHCPQPTPDNPDPWPELNPDYPILRSYDFGLTPACIFSQVTDAGVWFVFDELISRDMGFDEFSDEVLERSLREYRGFEFEDVGDPAGNQRSQNDTKTCFQIARAKGMAMQAAPQTLRIRLEGTRKPMRTVRRGKPMFVLHPNCKTVRKGLMGGYHYRKVHISGNVFENKPHKNSFSHPLDALTYAGAWLFGQELREPREDSLQFREPSALDDMTRSSTTGY
jgi:hypothetical protein